MREQARAAKRAERADRHRKIRELSEQGRSTREIAKQIGCSRKTVIRYLHEAKCPDWNPGRRVKSRLDEHRDFVEAWVAQGGRNAADLHRDLKEKGCPASYDAVRRFLARRIGSTGKPGPRPQGAVPAVPAAPPAATKMPTARRLSFAVLNPNLDANSAPDLLKRTRDRIPALDSALKLAEELAEMIRRRKAKTLEDWLREASESEIGELRSFAMGLKSDAAAVQTAMIENWSNGPVEGHVNRLKFVKRSMYGRAKFDLLRARVRNTN